ncbi:MAG: hypothetical protein ACI8S6_003203 [Myxococcota bacterium]
MQSIRFMVLSWMMGCQADYWCGRLNLDCESGAEDAPRVVIDADGDVWSAEEDCDDSNASVHPSAVEVCNGIDDDCDGEVDEGTGTIGYTDDDGDGYGDDAAPVVVCEGGLPPGVAWVGGDCDDGSAEVSPGRRERCGDGLDNDCNGLIDTEEPTICIDPDIPPCADGSWAGFSDPDAVTWIQPWGRPGGAGTRADPVDSLGAAVALLRAGGPVNIGIGPGTYVASDVRVFLGEGDAVNIAGCSAEEVVFWGAASSRLPLLSLGGGRSIGLRGVTVRGGGRGLVLRGEKLMTIEDVVVTAASRYGIEVAVGAQATLRRVTVAVSGQRDAEESHGIHIDGRATLEAVSVSDVIGTGIYAGAGAQLQGSGVTVARVASEQRRSGVGLYLNQPARVDLSGLEITAAAALGIAVLDAPDVSLSDCVVDAVSGYAGYPGDGIVVRRLGASGGVHAVSLSDCAVTGAARLGIAIEGDVAVTLTGVVADKSNGVVEGGSSIFAAPEASVTTDGVVTGVLDTVEWPLGRAYAQGPRKRR